MNTKTAYKNLLMSFTLAALAALFSTTGCTDAQASRPQVAVAIVDPLGHARIIEYFRGLKIDPNLNPISIEPPRTQPVVE